MGHERYSIARCDRDYAGATLAGAIGVHGADGGLDSCPARLARGAGDCAEAVTMQRWRISGLRRATSPVIME
jgi:hypothetical protein